MKNKIDLTTGDVGRQILALTFPMIFGIFAIVIFNFTDSFFVARLGTRELAALSFTFPVVMIVGGVAMGLGTATASVVSRAIGEGDYRQVKKLTTHALVISFLVVLLFVGIGISTIEPLFTFLGAGGDILGLIQKYMYIWYVGMIFLVVPMVGNNALRAAGDMLYPSFIMITAAVINICLDPILIFGWFGLPKLGITGAALATVIARAISLILSLGALHFRRNMLEFSYPGFKSIAGSAKKIFYIAVPSALTNMAIPFSAAIITRLVAKFGLVAVAAMGTASRAGAFSLMLIIALSTAFIPFVGQNWGAKNFQRVFTAIKYSNRFCLWWGIITMIFFAVSGMQLAVLFNRDSKFITYFLAYLWIVPLGYGFRGCCLLTIALFNAVNKPLLSSALSMFWIFGLYIPLAYAGGRIYGLKGIYAGMSTASIIASTSALYLSRKFLSKFTDLETTPLISSLPESTISI
ncbi:MAG: MATE family efflux transporter [Candidatus Omnitrophica bacterium]|nr:MATE family efflux transporter [Candidatus Omnitrophota bacterium]